MEIVGLINKEEKDEILFIAKLTIIGNRARFLSQEARENVLHS